MDGGPLFFVEIGGNRSVSKKESYEGKTEELLMPVIEAEGFELVDVEYVKEGSNWYLRTYIDKPGGITIDDCEIVSRALSAILDKEDYIKEAYILEVSSPGLLRPLKKEKDFVRNTGKEIEIRTYKMIDKQKEFVGVLKAFDKESVTIVNEIGEITFARTDIALIRPYVEF